MHTLHEMMTRLFWSIQKLNGMGITLVQPSTNMPSFMYCINTVILQKNLQLQHSMIL